MKDKPLLLVFDMDETLLYVDDKNVYEPTQCSIIYRKELYLFFNFLRKWFAKNLLLILWSAGDNSYVNEIVLRLNLDFDIVLGNSEVQQSLKEYDVAKSISFLCDLPKVKQWIDEKNDDVDVGPIVYAFVDDNAHDNSSVDDPYTYTFQVESINRETIFFENDEMFARVKSLFQIGDFLVYECLVKPEATIDIYDSDKTYFTTVF